MAYTASHTGRHHYVGHNWWDGKCDGCAKMTWEQEMCAQFLEQLRYVQFMDKKIYELWYKKYGNTDTRL